METSGEKLYMGSASQDQFSDEEVDTDRLIGKKASTGSPGSVSGTGGQMKDDSFVYETAAIATPDLTSSGDGVHLGGGGADVDPAEKERLEQEWRDELQKTEDEISTLRHVLSAKVQHAADLKRKLGITPLNEIKHDLSEGLKNIKESGAYRKTNEKLHNVQEKITSSQAYVKTGAVLKTAGEKTSSAISNLSTAVKGKLGDVRNSNTFKSFEERVGNAYTTVKSKVTGSKSEDNFEDILTSTSKDGGATATNNGTTATSPMATTTSTSPDGSR
ncbi:tumor protein D54-like isoform X3 [Tubulanus polymorphus]|uniref:tumor protein D54-like isoform X3 n=1 Tax=Tubulanus polymorphus TaxID=672921 RepID=UPI003DA67DBC